MLWVGLAGIVFLIIGLWTARGEFTAARGLDKLVALGPTLTAAALAAFGVEHFVLARGIVNVVPQWMPVREFWVYLAGAALIAAALSLAAQRYMRLSTTLLGVMILLFVLMIHVPNAIKVPNRFFIALAARDLSFSVGALAFAGAFGSGAAATACRIAFGLAAIFFGVEHLLHPTFAPGVPLQKQMPDWFPLSAVIGVVTGAILLVAGALVALNRRSRHAAAIIGALCVVLTVFVYVPILVRANPDGVVEGVNYVADTLLYGGIALLLSAVRQYK